jgi:hypothetical protein
MDDKVCRPEGAIPSGAAGRDVECRQSVPNSPSPQQRLAASITQRLLALRQPPAEGRCVDVPDIAVLLKYGHYRDELPIRWAVFLAGGEHLTLTTTQLTHYPTFRRRFRERWGIEFGKVDRRSWCLLLNDALADCRVRP